MSAILSCSNCLSIFLTRNCFKWNNVIEHKLHHFAHENTDNYTSGKMFEVIREPPWTWKCRNLVISKCKFYPVIYSLEIVLNKAFDNLLWYYNYRGSTAPVPMEDMVLVWRGFCAGYWAGNISAMSASTHDSLGDVDLKLSAS